MLICENGALVEVEDIIDVFAEGSEDDKLSELLDGLSEVKSLAEVRNTAQKVKGGENG